MRGFKLTVCVLRRFVRDRLRRYRLRRCVIVNIGLPIGSVALIVGLLLWLGNLSRDNPWIRVAVGVVVGVPTVAIVVVFLWIMLEEARDWTRRAVEECQDQDVEECSVLDPGEK